MKKDAKKLRLSRETVAGLDAPGNQSGLAAVRGGAGTASHTQLKEDCCVSKTH